MNIGPNNSSTPASPTLSTVTIPALSIVLLSTLTICALYAIGTVTVTTPGATITLLAPGIVAVLAFGTTITLSTSGASIVPTLGVTTLSTPNINSGNKALIVIYLATTFYYGKLMIVEDFLIAKFYKQKTI